jgi:hypothetical protein
MPESGAGPSIFAVLQEQLGLNLESGKPAAEVLVTDFADTLRARPEAFVQPAALQKVVIGSSAAVGRPTGTGVSLSLKAMNISRRPSRLSRSKRHLARQSCGSAK